MTDWKAEAIRRFGPVPDKGPFVSSRLIAACHYAFIEGAKAASVGVAQTVPEDVQNLPLIWQGWCNAIRLMEDRATVRRPESAAQAAAYEKCAQELRAALSSVSSTDGDGL